MKIEFADKRLALIMTKQAYKLGLPVAVLRSCRDKLVMLKDASTVLTLRNMKSLDYKKLKKFGRIPDQNQRPIQNEVQPGRNNDAADDIDHFYWRPTLKSEGTR